MAGMFEGKVALVTGAPAGIGRAMAEAAAREGAALALGDIVEAGEETAAALRAKGAKAFFVRTDVRKQSDIDALAARAVAEFGASPHIAFANAGVEGRLGAPWETGEEDFLRVIDINLAGAWRTMKAVLPAMLERGEGAIVATASVAGLVGAGGPPPMWPASTASSASSAPSPSTSRSPAYASTRFARA